MRALIHAFTWGIALMVASTGTSSAADCPGTCQSELATANGQKNVERYARALLADVRRCLRNPALACPCPTPTADALRGKLFTDDCPSLVSCQFNSLLVALFPGWDPSTLCFTGVAPNRCQLAAGQRAAALSSTRLKRHRLAQDAKNLADTRRCVAATSRLCNSIDPALSQGCLAAVAAADGIYLPLPCC